MAFIYVLPKHIWEAEADPVAFENEEMIGSGAFKPRRGQSRTSSSSSRPTRTTGARRPNIDGVIFQTISTTPTRASPR